jgi:hypothetical protein
MHLRAAWHRKPCHPRTVCNPTAAAATSATSASMPLGGCAAVCSSSCCISVSGDRGNGAASPAGAVLHVLDLAPHHYLCFVDEKAKCSVPL